MVAFVLFFLLLAGNAYAEPALLTWADLLPADVQRETSTIKDAKSLALAEEKVANAKLNSTLDGRTIRLKGFVVPLERKENGALTSFLLVPYFGACIHVPPPPVNQTVLVLLQKEVQNLASMDVVTVEGLLHVGASATDVADAGYVLKGAALGGKVGIPLPYMGRAFILTLLCGLSVCLGLFLPLEKLPHTLQILLLPAAAGMMCTLGLATLWGQSSRSAVLLFVGAVLLFGLGHLLSNHHDHREDSHFGCALAVALHNVPECFFVLSTALGNFTIGTLLGLSMMAHNIPLGLTLGGSFLETKQGKWSFLILAGILPPLLALGMYVGLRTIVSEDSLRLLYPLAGGFLVSVALIHLLPEAREQGSLRSTVAGFLCGCLLLMVLLAFVVHS